MFSTSNLPTVGSYMAAVDTANAFLCILQVSYLTVLSLLHDISCGCCCLPYTHLYS